MTYIVIRNIVRMDICPELDFRIVSQNGFLIQWRIQNFRPPGGGTQLKWTRDIFDISPLFIMF